jgi:2-polyprenyl-3-methyl-5-hydroxy-6-metoxy-1,4-benzoquinol methylase
MEEIIYQKQRELQNSHWWFRGRKDIVKYILKNIIKNNHNLILDIGSGSGGMISAIKELGTIESVELNKKLFYDLKKMNIKKIYHYDITKKRPNKKYNIITLFDVLEHIKNDEELLLQINNNLLKKRGVLVITVPAYNWLWTIHDDLNIHYRRYTKKEINRKLKKARLSIIKSTYFMTLLFPLAIASRVKIKLFQLKSLDLYMPPFFVNKVLHNIFVFERRIIDKISFPFGLSILIIAQKLK